MASGVTNPGAAPRGTTLLIANRGEIAVRIARTARRLGMVTVGVYSDADRHALHVGAVDLAVALGGAAPADSYLRGDAILEAAQMTGATAIHPGYGFLAENAEFAESVIAAGLVWVGPTPDQIRLLGDKVASKRAAQAAGVPTTGAVLVAADGSYDADELPDMPVLVKAAGGGGGRGMRIVQSADDLEPAIQSASREAGAAFGDATVFIEPYLQRGRHVEVQVFGDTHGNVVHLGERECSIQRRNQKVIEEAPSPGIDDDVRHRLRTGAVALAQRVGYVGAGTVEFMVGDPAQLGTESTSPNGAGGPTITFLEVNTRLQVEHPVTEAITGYDLVEWQLRVASGDPLPATQAEIDGRLARGLHAIEARLVAENPAADWMPSTGLIAEFTIAAEPIGFHRGPDTVRVDTGVAAGDVVSPNYDSLLAKVIAVADDRVAAAGVLAAAMAQTVVVGVDTNAALLAATLGEPDFLAGDTYTSYLSQHPVADLDGDVVDVLMLAATFADEARNRAHDAVTGFAPPGWRNLSTMGQRRSWLRNVGSETIAHHVEYRRPAPTGGPNDVIDVLIGDPPAIGDDGVFAPDERVSRAVEVEVVPLDDCGRPGAGSADIPSVRYQVVIVVDRVRRRCLATVAEPFVAVTSASGSLVWERPSRFADHLAVEVGEGPICPLPGTVIAVHVTDGATVQAGEVLMVVEAMKMEHQISAVVDSTVAHVRFATGDRVDAGDLLVELTPIDAEA